MAPGRTKVCAGKKERGQRLLSSLWKTQRSEKGGLSTLLEVPSSAMGVGVGVSTWWRRGHLPSKGPDEQLCPEPSQPKQSLSSAPGATGSVRSHALSEQNVLATPAG